MTTTVTVLFSLFGLLPACAGQEVWDLRTQPLARWSLEEEFRLGSVDGEHDAFMRPAVLKLDARNRIHVLDVSVPALRVFDVDGTFLSQIGRKGDGPGEYVAPVSFGFLGDTTWVVDGTTRRVALFGSDAVLLDDFVLNAASSGAQRPQPVDVFGADDFLEVVPPGPPASLVGSNVGRLFFRQSLVRRNRSGTRADTLIEYTVEPGFILTKRDGAGIVPYRPMSDIPLYSYDHGREEITEVQRRAASRADAAEFRVTVRGRDGRVLADRRFRYRPLKVPESVKDSLRNDMRSRFSHLASRDPHGAEENVSVALKHLSLPDFLPPVSMAVTVGEDGTRWIAREGLPGVTPARYLVTDVDLIPLGTLELPPPALRLIGPRTRDRIWALEEDRWGVQFLVRYRIRRDS